MWYSYATVRIVPRVERGEFVNVGVILFAREQEFLNARIELDRERLRALAPELDVDLVERHLRTFEDICAGRDRGGPVAALPASERFHWLVSPRSTMIQTSPVHAGRLIADDAADDAAVRLTAALEALLAEFVRLPATPGRVDQRA